MKPTWTSRRDDVLLEDAAAKRPCAVTAAKLHVSPAAIRSRLHRLRVKFGLSPDLRDDDLLEFIIFRKRVDLDSKFRALLARERQECGPSQIPGTDDPRPMSPVYVPVGGSSAGWCA